MNLFKRLMGLMPTRPLQIGDVLVVVDGIATIELPGGGTISARGQAAPGDRVFVRDGAIEGPAPDLPIDLIEV